MRPAEAIAWIRARIEIPAEDLTRFITNSKQTTFENDVHWARFYLVRGGLVGNQKRGSWTLTDDGRRTHLSPEQASALYIDIRNAQRLGVPKDEENLPAPGVPGDDREDDISYWFGGSMWTGDVDQMPRFLADGVWENECLNSQEDQFSVLVRRMKAGDRIAIKASFVQKNRLPFDVGGKPVSVMRIKATGMIHENPNDGRLVKVKWDPQFTPRDWYFYTYRTTLVEAEKEAEDARRLIDFTFRGVPQEYAWFLRQPYWLDKYGVANSLPDPPDTESTIVDDNDASEQLESYKLEDMVDDGCFLTLQELSHIYDRWYFKKNLILQGPPGTGKTWLAKRLAYVLLGSKDREAVRSRLRVVQFHPSLAYEDFVRGWRPAGDGKLALVDGILMEAIEAAKSEPDRPLVLVVEEINRGNPAQIFGEMLTLMENTKRGPAEAIELAYRRSAGERVYMPENLFIIGTMNVADRSLAIVDLAFRRRFAFVDLEPQLGPAWRRWCADKGINDQNIAEIETRICALNVQIAAATSLGPQFRIGHSYVTPEEATPDARAWFRNKVETEIGPLLDEYWYDSPETASTARAKLLIPIE